MAAVWGGWPVDLIDTHARTHIDTHCLDSGHLRRRGTQDRNNGMVPHLHFFRLWTAVTRVYDPKTTACVSPSSACWYFQSYRVWILMFIWQKLHFKDRFLENSSWLSSFRVGRFLLMSKREIFHALNSVLNWWWIKMPSPQGRWAPSQQQRQSEFPLFQDKPFHWDSLEQYKWLLL